MARARASTPSGHGELLLAPAYADWAGLVATNAEAASMWAFRVCGVDIHDVRARAREEAVDAAHSFSRRMGIPARAVDGRVARVVMTGHQPELYHPGVWVKDFLLQRLADETGATAIDIVVDSDGFDSVSLHAPCMRPGVDVCRVYLALGGADAYFGGAPAPSTAEIAAFRDAGLDVLHTLPAPALARHFALFCDALDAAHGASRSLAELVTSARRRYEAPAGTDYLELPVSEEACTGAFRVFLADIAREAPRFAAAYNAELASYREGAGIRSAAQPFPDLATDGDLVELPFWNLQGGRRRTLWARTGASPALVCDGEVLAELGGTCSDAAASVGSSAVRPAPKALALTLFNRVFVADLFIHGVGGGRYDRVTDGVIRRYYDVEPPRFVVASTTMYLPLGAHVATDEEIDAVTQALHRLEHNPDRMLDELDFDDDGERARAVALAAEKGILIEAIAAPDADRKVTGRRIREVNAELSELLGPVETGLRSELERLTAMRDAGAVFTDRTYPFCLWSPQEVADKVR